VKIIKMKMGRKITGAEVDPKKEISILKEMKHENVIELIDVLKNERKHKIYLVLEYCPTNLQEVLEQSEGVLPPWVAHKYFVQLISGLKHLHSHGIIHRFLFLPSFPFS